MIYYPADIATLANNRLDHEAESAIVCVPSQHERPSLPRFEGCRTHDWRLTLLTVAILIAPARLHRIYREQKSRVSAEPLPLVSSSSQLSHRSIPIAQMTSLLFSVSMKIIATS
jgi:hypothetical protein